MDKNLQIHFQDKLHKNWNWLSEVADFQWPRTDFVCSVLITDKKKKRIKKVQCDFSASNEISVSSNTANVFKILTPLRCDARWQLGNLLTGSKKKKERKKKKEKTLYNQYPAITNV